MGAVVTKFVRPEVKVDEDGIITATLSTEAEDRDGEVVRADGWQLDHFNRHPVLMANHDYSIRSQIGEWKNVRIEHGKLVGEPHYYTGIGNEDADWAYKLAKMGKAAYSVGFVPIESSPRGKGVAQEYTKQELLECSHVAIPSNREALQLAVKSVKAGPVADIINELLAEPEKKGAAAYDPDFIVGVLMDAHGLRRSLKAGRTISGANMDKLHSAMGALHDVHDAACNDPSCPLGGGADGDADDAKSVKAAAEGSGSAGGVTVAEDGSHKPFTGKHDHEPYGSHEHDGDANHQDLATKAPASTASQNDLPDSAFAVISPGGTKDADGKTTPRSLRHLPHHKADGSIDLPHLKDIKNALARVSQTDLTPEERSKAEAHLEAHAKAEKIGDYADGKGVTNGLDPQALAKSVEDDLTKALEAAGW